MFQRWGSSHPNMSYPSRLSQYLLLDPKLTGYAFSVENYGVCGTTAKKSSNNPYWKTEVRKYAPTKIALKH